MRDTSSAGNRTHNPQSRSPAVENRHQSRVDASTTKAKGGNFTGLDKPPGWDRWRRWRIDEGWKGEDI